MYIWDVLDIVSFLSVKFSFSQQLLPMKINILLQFQKYLPYGLFKQEQTAIVLQITREQWSTERAGFAVRYPSVLLSVCTQDKVISCMNGTFTVNKALLTFKFPRLTLKWEWWCWWCPSVEYGGPEEQDKDWPSGQKPSHQLHLLGASDSECKNLTWSPPA